MKLQFLIDYLDFHEGQVVDVEPSFGNNLVNHGYAIQLFGENYNTKVIHSMEYKYGT